MRSLHGWSIVLILFILLLAAGPAAAAEPRLETALARLSLSFVENRGQADPRAAYVAGPGQNLRFTPQALELLLPGSPLRLEFLGARPDARPRAEGMTPAVVSYFSGQPSSWITGVPTYSRLVYEELWPGIDLIFSGTGGRLKYELLVRPGADPRRVRFAYRGATRLAVNARGELEVETPAGGFHEVRPISFQTRGGREVDVATAYDLDAATASYGFRLGAYDPGLPLLIDPEVFVYAGYFAMFSGDPEFDSEGCGAVAVDGAGNAYVLCTSSYSPPGSPTIFRYVAKVNATGTAILWTAYIGASTALFTSLADIAVDGAGNAYVVGQTAGSGFPVVSGPDTSFNGGARDGFVTKIDAAGTSLLYSGFIGGSGSDEAHGIAVDGAGNAYVAGQTNSTETTFPDGDGFGALTGPDTTYNGASVDGFFVKVNAAGTGFLNASYIGGAGNEFASGIALDPLGNAYLAGRTGSTQATFPDGDGFGPLTGPDTTHNGVLDAFVAKVDAAGTAFLWAGYVGGADIDEAGDVAVDTAGNPYIAGRTASTQSTFPDGDGFGALSGADTTYNGGFEDAFVAKVDAAGTTLLWASYVGGGSSEHTGGIALDAAGNAYVAGRTSSNQSSFPDGDGFGGLSGPDPTYNGGSDDGFVVKVAATGTPFLWASYIGGNVVDSESAAGIAVDGDGAAYVAGHTHAKGDTFPDGDGMGGLTTFNPGPGGGGSDSSGFLLKIRGPDQPGDYFTLTPCRIVDTRGPAGPQGGPALAANVERTFPLAGTCGIPSTAIAVALNVTAVSATADGNLQVFAASTAAPPSIVSAYRTGLTRANNAVVALGTAGAITARANQASGSVHLVLDVVGYFAD